MVSQAFPEPAPSTDAQVVRAQDAHEQRAGNQTQLEAAAFRRLLVHLNQVRPDVQNIDLMILAGFCRNCLSDWYREAAEAEGVPMTKDAAREAIYGIPFAEWKAKHQHAATPKQLAAFEAAQRRHSS